ncbi:MAG: HNH endonuclease, partial [Myxococcales bacterium]|nr:HNH endonuclease [Myxococcales bacterium]
AAKPMHQIAITQCSDCRKAWHDVAGHTIELSAAELAQASCDAELLGRVDGDKPARVTKTIPPRTRRAVLRRDRGRCVVPGCRNARYVDVHHIVPRAEGGDHTPTKLAALCSAHHTAAHDGRLRVDGIAPGKLRFVHADGRPYGAPPASADASAASHVGDQEPVAPPHAGGAIDAAPSPAGAKDEAIAPERRRAPAPAARRTRGSAKAGGRERLPTPAALTVRNQPRNRPTKASASRHAKGLSPARRPARRSRRRAAPRRRTRAARTSDPSPCPGRRTPRRS